MILAGDVGATKTHLALFERSEKKKWIADQKYKSGHYESLSAIIKQFLSSNPAKIERACFGVPGAVIDGKCNPTNLPWVVETQKLSKELGIPVVFLINDLEANAYGISCLGAEELYPLNEGKKHGGNQAIISAGTGLGEAGIFWNGNGYLPFATEGGHGTFSPENEVEFSLYRYLKREFEHVSFERILSGSGLYRIYRFLIDTELEIEKEDVKKAFKESEPPRVITERAMKGTDPACERALELFVGIYGSEAGNLALKMLAIGGVYIGGGIAPKILAKLKEGPFMKRFSAKGRMHSFLSNIPIRVILNENTALLGAAEYVRKMDR